MTLSVGDYVRKYTRDGAGPVENESHVLFEVTELGPYEYDAESGTQRQTITVKVVS